MDYSNYDSSRTEAIYSWPIIFLALYLFFPLGIYMIFKKTSLHRRNIFTIGKKTFSLAISLFLFGFWIYLPKILLWLIKDSSDAFQSADDLTMALNSNFYLKLFFIGRIFFLTGFLVLMISFYQRYKSKRYRNYINIIVNKGIEDLDEITQKMNLSKKKVISDIKVLLNKGYLSSKYEIDIDQNRIYDIVNERESQKEQERKKELNTRVVKCPNCHANNKLEEKVGKCAYCNSYIE